MLTTIALCLGLIAVDAGGAAPGDDPPRPPAAQGSYRLQVRGADHPAVELDGRTLRGEVWIAVVPSRGLRRATFYLDDPSLRIASQTENKAPFDFRGGAPGKPTPWDTREVTDGPHTIHVELVPEGGATVVLEASFTVGNAPPALVFDPPILRRDFLEGSTVRESVPLQVLGEPGTPFVVAGDIPAWLAVSPAAGTSPATITVEIIAESLGRGEQSVTLAAVAKGVASGSVRVVAARHESGTTLAREVERHGIAWEFEAPHPVGHFASGDPWVLGPVTIVQVRPGWDGTHDGSMVDPRYRARHGYDARWQFEPALRVSFPRTVAGSESIISVDSWRAGEPGCPDDTRTLPIPRPALKSAAVLTVVEVIPRDGAFRPAYAGTEKRRFHVDQLHPDRLPRLRRVPSTPRGGGLVEKFDGVWLDHISKWMNRYLHPSLQMRDYSRDLATDFNVGSLFLMLDVPEEEKSAVMIRLVQIGIDMYAVLKTGARYGDGGGGIGSGRKWPILLAGILLDDPEMMGIGGEYGPVHALEDCQTFFLTAADLPRYPGLAVGTPVWGERHCTDPPHYQDPGKTAYRTCCTANAWVGAVLSAHILGAKELWNHDPLFDYQDRYMAEQTPGHWQRSLSDFAEEMWDRYRPDYGPIWSPK